MSPSPLHDKTFSFVTTSPFLAPSTICAVLRNTLEKANLFVCLGKIEDTFRFSVDNAEYHENTIALSARVHDVLHWISTQSLRACKPGGKICELRRR